MPHPEEDHQQSTNHRYPRFDHFVVELLQHNNGVFFGELHDHPELRQAISKLLPRFKANGVESFSLELPQNLVDEMKGFADSNVLKKRWPRASEQLVGAFEVVKAAQKLGLQVVGHEIPWPTTLRRALEAQQEGEGEILEARSLWAVSEKGMKERDDFAVLHIRSNRRGKILVIGGWNHSGNFTRADMDDPGRETDYGYTKSQDTRCGYQGLDLKLGIPSIDYKKANATESLGGVNKTNGKFSTYEVALPDGGLGNLYPSRTPAQRVLTPNIRR